LIVAHGERGGRGDDRFARTVADRLKAQWGEATVETCFLAKEPCLQSVLAGLPGRPVIICPLFMSEGYFVERAIPAALASAGYGPDTCPPAVILEPVGLHPELHKLVADQAAENLEMAGFAARDCHLMLAAHGAKAGTASRDATLRLTDKIAGLRLFAGIEQGFLEEPPFLDEQLMRIEGPAVVAGLFIGEGMHGSDDLRHAITSCGRSDILLSTPLAQSHRFMDLICRDLNNVFAPPATTGLCP
jgi:sirohydrochlorin ferrochelatase